MQDLVRNVGGARVHVVGILRPNVDPHDFEPTPSTVVALADAKLVVESGVGLDAWADQLVESAGTSAPVFDASAGLHASCGRSALVGRPGARRAGGDGARRTGWARSIPGTPRRTLETARATSGQWRAWTPPIAGWSRPCPPADRKLVTNHDAFNYLAAHYGIRVVGSVIPALSTAAQPSAQDVADLIDRIRAEHVRAIFTESSLDPALERQIGSEAGVRVYADLYGDTLGPPGSPGATYLGMERWNVRAMVAGFLGRPPPKA